MHPAFRAGPIIGTATQLTFLPVPLRMMGRRRGKVRMTALGWMELDHSPAQRSPRNWRGYVPVTVSAATPLRCILRGCYIEPHSRASSPNCVRGTI